MLLASLYVNILIIVHDQNQHINIDTLLVYKPYSNFIGPLVSFFWARI